MYQKEKLGQGQSRRVLIKTKIDGPKTFCDRHRLYVRNTDYMWETQSLWLKQTVWERFKLSVTDTYCLGQANTFSDIKRFPVTVIYCLLQKLTVIYTYCFWQIHTVCDTIRLSVTDRDCLSQTQIFCDRKGLSVTDTDCLLQTQTGKACCLRQRHKVLTTDMLNITNYVNIKQQYIYYFHTQNNAIILNQLCFIVNRITTDLCTFTEKLYIKKLDNW